MIEDESLGLKIAENPKEALIAQAIESTEKRITASELSVEIDKVVLDYLKSKR